MSTRPLVRMKFSISSVLCCTRIASWTIVSNRVFVLHWKRDADDHQDNALQEYAGAERPSCWGCFGEWIFKLSIISIAFLCWLFSHKHTHTLASTTIGAPTTIWATSAPARYYDDVSNDDGNDKDDDKIWFRLQCPVRVYRRRRRLHSISLRCQCWRQNQNRSSPTIVTCAIHSQVYWPVPFAFYPFFIICRWYNFLR